MVESPEQDATDAEDSALPSPPGDVERGLRPLYLARPREFYMLWLVALATYGLGDTVTTTVAVLTTPAFIETNPIVGTVLALGGLSGFLMVKLLVLLVMLAISVRGTQWNDRFTYYWPPLATASVGALLTGWNLWLLASAG